MPTKKRSNLKTIKEDLTEVYMPKTHPSLPRAFFGALRARPVNKPNPSPVWPSGLAVILCVIYALMAIPFRSYIQPLIIMSVIPFGLVGAIIGHLLLLRDFSVLSILGYLALTGVVVNDSLVMVDLHQSTRNAVGNLLRKAVWDSGAARFRPIFLTSLTTLSRANAHPYQNQLASSISDTNGNLTRLWYPICDIL